MDPHDLPPTAGSNHRPAAAPPANGSALDPGRSGARLEPAQARELLRRLRDLNLSALVRVAGGRRVAIEGCLSLDHPIDEELRYALNVQGDSAHVLSIGWREGLLHVALSDSSTRDLSFSLAFPLWCDEAGRATAPELQARIDPESTDPREVEHFLRRVVRRAFAA